MPPSFGSLVISLYRQDHHGGPVKDVEGVAETAAGNLPTAAGGLMVRLDAVDPPSLLDASEMDVNDGQCVSLNGKS